MIVVVVAGLLSSKSKATTTTVHLTLLDNIALKTNKGRQLSFGGGAQTRRVGANKLPFTFDKGDERQRTTSV